MEKRNRGGKKRKWSGRSDERRKERQRAEINNTTQVGQKQRFSIINPSRSFSCHIPKNRSPANPRTTSGNDFCNFLKVFSDFFQTKNRKPKQQKNDGTKEEEKNTE
jgi:hypothetical protein